MSKPFVAPKPRGWESPAQYLESIAEAFEAWVNAKDAPRPDIFMTDYGPVEVTPKQAEYIKARETAKSLGHALPGTQGIVTDCLIMMLEREAFLQSKKDGGA